MVARAWRGRWRRGAAAAALAALLLAALAVRLPARSASVAEFPRVSPARLAHLLADFSHRHTSTGGQWTLEEEKSNYTWWQYSVRYSCGARCEGRAGVEAHEVPGGGGAPPAHGPPPGAHRVRLTDERCLSLPLLPWPQFCEETETDTWVFPLGGVGAGARVQEAATARCGAARALSGACARDLRDAARRRLQRLRDAVSPPPHRT